MIWLMVLAGGLGAAARFVVDAVLRARIRQVFPVGTLVINVTGSFLLGVLLGFAGGHPEAAPWVVVGGAGFCGGFTTFSTASAEALALAQQRRWWAFSMQVSLMVVSCVFAAAGGYLLAR